METSELHFKKRIKERLVNLEEKEMEAILVVIRKLLRMARKRELPNEDWFKSVYFQGKRIASFAGRGNYISTVLSGRMQPKGKRVR